MSGPEAKAEDLGHIRLKTKPPTEDRHGLDAGQVHKVIKMHDKPDAPKGMRKRGWWIQGDGEPVLILWREATREAPA